VITHSVQVECDDEEKSIEENNFCVVLFVWLFRSLRS
jgi:hypothetical protein